MKFSYREFCAAADGVVDSLPGALRKDVVFLGEEREEECAAFTDGRRRGRDLIFGYFHDFYGQKRIVLCYWAFRYYAEHMSGPAYDWRRHLAEVIAHELQHYLESDLSFQPLAEEEKRKRGGY